MMNDSMARTARPRDAKYAMSDIRGLYMEVMPTGRKFWRLRYSVGSKRSWHTIGEYPIMTLDAARAKTHELQDRLKNGLPLVEPSEPTTLFSEIAAQWEEHNETRSVVDLTKRRAKMELHKYVLPFLGDKDIKDIDPPDVLAVLQRIASQGKPTTVSRVKAIISNIFRMAAARGLVMYDPCSVLVGAIKLPEGGHLPSIRREDDLKRLLIGLNSYKWRDARLATLFLIYSLCRPGEMRRAEWSEIDLEKAEWKIPPDKMKRRRPHIVPLSRQLIELLTVKRSMGDVGRYVFHTREHGDTDKPMTGSPVRRALDNLGFTSKDACGHGFRSTGSTILNENGFDRDWIELQLAHAVGSPTRAAYNHAEHLADRRRMLQWYADHLDELRGEPMNLS